MNDVVDPQPCYPLAREALRLAVRGDDSAAVRAVQHLVAEHGPAAIGSAMCVWVDAVLAYLPPAAPEQTVVLHALDVDGREQGIDTFPAPAVWSGRLIAARAADDRPTWQALAEAEVDDATWTLRVLTLLLVCAVNVRASKDLGRRPVHVWPMRNGG